MDNRLARTANTLVLVLAWAKDWLSQIADAGLEDTLEDLRTLDESVKELAARIPTEPGRSHRGEQVETWTAVLREALQNLRSAVGAYLLEQSGKPVRVKVPPSRAAVGTLIDAANQARDLVAPRLAELPPKNVVRRRLAEMDDAADQLFKWMLVAPDDRREVTAARRELEQQVSRGRRLIKHIGDALKRHFREDPRMKTQFDAAANVTEKPGPSPAVSKPKRERTPYRKRPKRHLARPERIETPLTPEMIERASAKDKERLRKRQRPIP